MDAYSGYAADGYARAQGIGCVAVTFTVGGLSVINAIAGAMSEHLPVVCLTGCPNSNDFGGDKILHHTIGEVDFSQELRCARARRFPASGSGGLKAQDYGCMRLGWLAL